MEGGNYNFDSVGRKYPGNLEKKYGGLNEAISNADIHAYLRQQEKQQEFHSN